MRRRPTWIPTTCIERLRSAGQQHGPAFRGIVGLTVSESGAARAEVRLPSAAKTGSRHFLLHPVMIDIALQALGGNRRRQPTSPGRRPRPDRGAAGTFGRCPGVRRRDRRVFARRLAEGDNAVRIGWWARWSLTGRTGRCCWYRRSRDGGGRGSPAASRTHQPAVHPGVGAVRSGPAIRGRAAAVLLVGDLVAGRPAADRPALLACASGPRTAEVVFARRRSRRCGRRSPAPTSLGTHRRGLSARAVDESLPERGQLDLAQARTLLIADIVQDGVAHGGPEQLRGCGSSRAARSSSIPVIAVTLAQTRFVESRGCSHSSIPELKTTIVDIDADGAGSACRPDRGVVRRLRTRTRWPCGTDSGMSTGWWPRRTTAPSGRPVVESRRTVGGSGWRRSRAAADRPARTAGRAEQCTR